MAKHARHRKNNKEEVKERRERTMFVVKVAALIYAIARSCSGNY
ncbi:hypothetical protein [Streptomyces asiaticus]